MKLSILRGGKLSPRLLKDLQYYNPQLISYGGDNVLTNLPPPYDDETQVFGRRYPPDSCQHDWMIKDNQSVPLGGDLKIGELYVIAACCAKCRCHVALLIEVRADTATGWPCSGCHHFVHDADNSPGFSSQGEDKQVWNDEQHFKCSASGCSAGLKVAMFSPQLSGPDVETLTSRSQINDRAKAAIAADPERLEGIAIPAPVEVLHYLRTYLTNSLKDSTPHRISSAGKKWQISFGDACRELLEKLHFTRQPEHWMPPEPEVNASKPYENPVNMKLDDVLLELNILIAAQPAHERQRAGISYSLAPAQGEMSTLLNCRDYRKKPFARGEKEPSYDEEHPWYTCLGANIDFHDDLLIEAYRRQVACDERNEPVYFDCLRGLCSGRDSDALLTEVAIQESKGTVGVSGIEEAYRAFNFDKNNWSLTDDMIIGSFEARVTDSPPAQANELKRQLKIIGKHRGSSKIVSFVENEVHTCEQAMAYLGVTDEMTDDFIITMAQVKLNDNPHSERQVNRALHLIADQRGSSGLRSFAETREVDEMPMSVPGAYECLGVAEGVDEETVEVGYQTALKDKPYKKADLNKALKIVAEHMKSAYLLNKCEGSSPNFQDPADWPVGLENLANACHFNSTLQMLYSIKPFREFILDSESHKKALEGSRTARLRVGSRDIKRAEVKQGRQFLDEMHETFFAMKTSPMGCVAPNQDLIQHAFEPPAAAFDSDSPEALAGSNPFEDIATTLASSQAQSGGDEGTAASSETARSDVSVQSSEQSQSTKASEDAMQGLQIAGDSDEKSLGKLTTTKLTADKKASPVDTSYRQQQDVTETVFNTFFRLSCAIVPTNGDDPAGSDQEDFVTEMFNGKTRELNAESGESLSDEISSFSIISVNTRPTLEEAIEANWCSKPEGSDKYRYNVVTKLPQVFQVQIIRRQFDAAKGAWKDETDVQIPETLHLGHFLESASEEDRKTWREVARDTSHVDQDLGDGIDHLTKALSNTKLPPLEANELLIKYARERAADAGEPDPEFYAKLARTLEEKQAEMEQDIKSRREELTVAKASLQAKREKLSKTVPYRLHSVFVHRGTADSGHYYVFIRDFKKDLWRVYNDKNVETADPAQAAIFHNHKESNYANSGTPFFLTYVAADKVESYVDPVCREIAPVTVMREVVQGEGLLKQRPLAPAPEKKPAELKQVDGAMDVDTQ